MSICELLLAQQKTMQHTQPMQLSQLNVTTWYNWLVPPLKILNAQN